MIFSDEIRITIHQKPTTFPSPLYPRPQFQWPKSHLESERGRRAPTMSHPWFASRLVHLSSTFKIFHSSPDDLGDLITCIPTCRDVDAPVKGTVQLNSTAQRQQKEQQQKRRQRSSARSNDSRVSAPTSHHHSTPEGVPRWISGPSNSHQDFHHRYQQPTTSRTNVKAPTVIQFQPSQQPIFPWAHGTGTSTSCFQQPQQLDSTGAPGTGASGTRMPVPSAAYFQQT